MSKFKFEYQDDEEKTNLTMQFEVSRWDEALNQFVKFLRGSGYRLEDNSVGINQSVHAWAGDNYELSSITTFDGE